MKIESIQLNIQNNVQNIKKSSNNSINTPINISMDTFVKSVNEDFNISNPYNFKSTQEKSSTIKSDKFNVNDLQGLLFHTTFQTNPSTLDDDLLPENQKLKKQLEEQLNTLLENGDLSDEKTRALIKELQEKLALLEKYGNEEILTEEKLKELVAANKTNTYDKSRQDVKKLI